MKRQPSSSITLTFELPVWVLGAIRMVEAGLRRLLFIVTENGAVTVETGKEGYVLLEPRHLATNTDWYSYVLLAHTVG